MRIGCVVLILATSLLFADTRPPDACKLLTAEDLVKVVGSGFKLIDSKGTASDNSYCAYTKGGSNIVNLMIVGSPEQNAAETLAKMQENYKKNGLTVIPVSNAGEGAFYSESAKSMSLHFGKGLWQGVLDVTLKGKPDSEAEQKLAAIAYSRFP